MTVDSTADSVADRACDRVLVAMSGGVDSSVAAGLLVEAGYEVTGITLKLWGGESDSGCCSVSDVEDARRVAAQLGIPHYVFNLTDEFSSAIVDPYVAAYAQGRTPNPCVDCNRVMKFGMLLDRAEAMGFETIATGHHAKVRCVDGRYQLLRATDPAKDQSYVLAMLGQRELSKVRFPIGEMTKADVREHAHRLGLRTATKAESMDVCFITKGGRESFLAGRIADISGIEVMPGPIVEVGGGVVGHHEGVASFTIGQRRGLGIAAGERRYVVDVDAETATVTIGKPDDLLRDEIVLSDLRFVDGSPAITDMLGIQVRAHGRVLDGRLDGGVVRYTSPQPRVAPGQLVAFYDEDSLVGSGIAE